MKNNIVELEKERFEWSSKTFPEATAISSLYKLKDEIDEIIKDIIDGKRRPEEYADCLMCLFDSGGRQEDPILPEEMFEAFSKKLSINKARIWIKNENNTYSHKK